MKFITSQLAYFLKDVEIKKNFRALGKSLAFIGLVMVLYAFVFQLLQRWLEGEYHSIWSALYWTVVTMSTLGYGDITFTTDLGRVYSTFVLISGVVLLLIVLPFTFIRYFYAPWLEAQIRLRAPRRLPQDVSDHVIITEFDSVARGLISKLNMQKIPHVILVDDARLAGDLMSDGYQVVFGDRESEETYVAARVENAQLVFANSSDTENTNITITVRDLSESVPIAAIAAVEDSIDILELSGCTHVLALRKRLGEFLANRIIAGKAESHIIGSFKNLFIAEVPVHNTPLSGKTVRETRLRENTGLSVVAVWERGRVHPASPDTRLLDQSVPVVVGSREQLQLLDELLFIYDINPNPVIIIGGGKVGRAATRALKAKGVPVTLVEKKESLRPKFENLPDKLIMGDAAERRILEEAGINEAPSVILTTNDDGMNIYLAVYCRRLNSELHIVSRLTNERNLEAIHRAGADFVLSYDTLCINSIMSILQGSELVLLGEGIDFFYVAVPEKLVGKSLAESGIGARTGLNVVAIKNGGLLSTSPEASVRLAKQNDLLMIGSVEQRKLFADIFES